MSIDREKVECVGRKLSELPSAPPKGKMTVRQAVDQMARELEQLRARGYTISEIATILSSEGLPITESTLRRYLRVQTAGQRRERQRMQRAPAAVQAAAQMAAQASDSGE